MSGPMFEAVFLACALSLDAFLASFAYGSQKIKIPVSSAAVIDLVCSGILGASLILGGCLRPYLSPMVSRALCCFILSLMGLAKLLDQLIKSLIRKRGGLSRDLHFSLRSLNFVLQVYADPETADADCSKSLSLPEAASLAAALSLDGMAVGFGASLGNVHGWAVLCASLAAGAIAVLLGARLGNRLAAKLPFDLSWISGLALLALAFAKLF